MMNACSHQWIDPNDPRIVYGALWQARRQPWNFSSGGPGSGLYRSADGGVTWKRLAGNGLPEGILGRIHVSVSAADSTVAVSNCPNSGPLDRRRRFPRAERRAVSIRLCSPLASSGPRSMVCRRPRHAVRAII